MNADEGRFHQTVTMYGGTWKRHRCKRVGHDSYVVLTSELTLALVCLRCRAAGDLDGIELVFARSPSSGVHTAGGTP